MRTPACTRHTDLVARATSDDPSDADLERYAEEIPDCVDCQRVLAVVLQVHPTVLAQGGTRSVADGWRAADPRQRGLASLHEALLRPRVAVWRWVGGAVTVVAAAGLLWVLTGPRPEAYQPPRTPVVTAAPDAPGLPQPTLKLPPTPPLPVLAEPAVVRRLVELQRVHPERERLPPLQAPPPPADETDAVASLDTDDWSPPPFEDLRTGGAKGGEVGSVRLLLSGAAPRSVHDAVSLTVIAEATTALSVCVSGPEQGVVWRGAVPSGRTELAREGRLQSFAFARAGTYHFAIAATAEGCAEPAQELEVEVEP